MAPSREALSKYAQQQWEALMLFLVGSTDRPPAASPHIKAPRLAVEAILAGAGLMTGSKSGFCSARLPGHCLKQCFGFTGPAAWCRGARHLGGGVPLPAAGHLQPAMGHPARVHCRR